MQSAVDLESFSNLDFWFSLLWLMEKQNAKFPCKESTTREKNIKKYCYHFPSTFHDMIVGVTQPDAKLMLAPPKKAVSVCLTHFHTYGRAESHKDTAENGRSHWKRRNEGRGELFQRKKGGWRSWDAAWHESAKFMRIFKRCHWDRWRNQQILLEGNGPVDPRALDTGTTLC